MPVAPFVWPHALRVSSISGSRRSPLAQATLSPTWLEAGQHRPGAQKLERSVSLTSLACPSPHLWPVPPHISGLPLPTSLWPVLLACPSSHLWPAPPHISLACPSPHLWPALPHISGLPLLTSLACPSSHLWPAPPHISLACPSSHLSGLPLLTSLACPSPHLSGLPLLTSLACPSPHLSGLPLLTSLACPSPHLSGLPLLTSLACPSPHLWSTPPHISGLLDDIPHAHQHDAFHLQQPFLHCPPGCTGGDDLTELHLLPLRAEHGQDVQVAGKLQLGYAFKALLEVGLDTGGILGLCQDLKHLIIGQEEEPSGQKEGRRREEGREGEKGKK